MASRSDQLYFQGQHVTLVTPNMEIGGTPWTLDAQRPEFRVSGSRYNMNIIIMNITLNKGLEKLHLREVDHRMSSTPESWSHYSSSLSWASYLQFWMDCLCHFAFYGINTPLSALNLWLTAHCVTVETVELSSSYCLFWNTWFNSLVHGLSCYLDGL
jgi:hypothetical protein